MAILVNNIRIALQDDAEKAYKKAYDLCALSKHDAKASVYKRSIDARRGNITQVLSVLIEGAEDEHKLVERLDNPNIRIKVKASEPKPTGDKRLENPPVVIGLGPAGLFAAYILAKNGYNPTVLERGESIENRDKAVAQFWDSGIFSPSSNIQFGEGGAGAYSDGKLTTRIHDPLSELVLQIFVKHGAPREILQKAKPHIGTDVLKNVVSSMRQEIEKNGGKVYFGTQMTGIIEKDGKLAGIYADRQKIPCTQAVAAIGHSARDTFLMLHENSVAMTAKPFSVGARIEHKQSTIDAGRYGKMAGNPLLPPAEYMLSHRENGRACYTFCMCPGGQIVAAQSEEHTVVTNGMSYHARDGINANAAVAVSVVPEDFDSSSVFAGIEFQRKIEQNAYRRTGSYRAPAQTVGDFLSGRASKRCGSVKPTYPIGVEYGSFEGILPDFVINSMQNGIRLFGKKLKGFDSDDAVLTAPETRTSSPVRIVRSDEKYSLSTDGFIPCGEGAGYAGGIVSAAVDGIVCACTIMSKYRPIEE